MLQFALGLRWNGLQMTDEELLKEFESSADDFVIEERMLSVCAYVSNRLSSNLNTVLEQSHKYIMTDDEFHLSSQYIE